MRPPVQKLVASLLFAIGEKAIESLILSRINSGVRTSEVHAKAAHTGGFFIGREGIRTNFHATARWAVAATSSKTGGNHTFRLWRKGNRIPHPLPNGDGGHFLIRGRIHNRSKSRPFRLWRKGNRIPHPLRLSGKSKEDVIPRTRSGRGNPFSIVMPAI